MSEPHDEQSPSAPGDPGPPGDAGGSQHPGDAGGSQHPGDAGQGAAQPPPTAAGGEPRDPNTDAIERAGVDPRMTQWLHQVAGQVDARLDRVAPRWREAEQAEAARACAFGLLLAQLAGTYPHAREPISRVVEAHPSYSTLDTGGRLVTLERIAGDPAAMAAWVGPLIGVTDPQGVRPLLD